MCTCFKRMQRFIDSLLQQLFLSVNDYIKEKKARKCKPDRMELKWKTDSFLLFCIVRCFLKSSLSLFWFVLVQNSNVYLV